MSERKRNRKWEVIVIRHRGEYLGTVTAVDQRAAERAAVKLFKVDARRLLIRPR